MSGFYYVDDMGEQIDLPIGKVLCVGQNYADHVKEMGSKTSQIPMLFMKPSTAIVDIHQPIVIPTNQGECHNELEVALLIKSRIDQHTSINLSEHIWGAGLALDLTLRDIQRACKEKGHPWERAKSFDGSCPVSQFVALDKLQRTTPLDNLSFELLINGNTRQSGNTQNMIFGIETLLNEIKQQFTLLPGDLVLTGTPKGVGPLEPGDRIDAKLGSFFKVQSLVTSSQVAQ